MDLYVRNKAKAVMTQKRQGLRNRQEVALKRFVDRMEHSGSPSEQ